MGRNSELIRQWTVLQHLAAGRGSTIPKLANELGVTTRTIRRDLDALQTVGFPIYDEVVNGTKFWRLDPGALGAFARSGLTFAQLCALYFSRALLECFAGTHLLADLQGAFAKFEAALSPAMRKFLERLPRVIAAKPPHAKRQDKQTWQTTAILLEASLRQRTIAMRYHSHESGREKEYLVHPYRLVQAQGGLYLIAFVPAYAEVRTFAVERIRRVSAREQTFEPVPELESDPFRNSLGVHRGPACRVQLRFHPRLAASIKDRTWHASQRLKDRSDGSLVMTLDVSDDYALRSWILGFGRFVRVLAPAHLAEWALEELDAAREQYVTGSVERAVDPDLQPPLPFVFGRLAGP
jgi:predicted DNA-binding transcriptional regulator YafY